MRLKHAGDDGEEDEVADVARGAVSAKSSACAACNGKKRAHTCKDATVKEKDETKKKKKKAAGEGETVEDKENEEDEESEDEGNDEDEDEDDDEAVCKCDSCDAVYKGQSAKASLQRHMKKKHPAGANAEKLFPCEHCDLVYRGLRGKTSLNRHIRTKHNEESDDKDDSEDANHGAANDSGSIPGAKRQKVAEKSSARSGRSSRSATPKSRGVGASASSGLPPSVSTSSSSRPKVPIFDATVEPGKVPILIPLTKQVQRKAGEGLTLQSKKAMAGRLYKSTSKHKFDLSNKEVVQAGKAPSMAAVLAAIDSVFIPSQKNRKNISAGEVTGMPLGVINTRRGFGSSTITQSRRNLCKVLNRWARSVHPDFTYTSIQVNKTTRFEMHVDRNNLGPSLFIAIGDFQGGGLWVDGIGTINAKYKWCIFNGNHGHMTLPFKGTRYSFVFFTQSSYRQVPQDDWDDMTINMEFPFPVTPAGRPWVPAAADRVAAALHAHGTWLKTNVIQPLTWDAHTGMKVNDFECEHDCGFDGSEEMVEAHEKKCKKRPNQNDDSDSDSESDAASSEEEKPYECEHECGFDGASMATVEAHELTCSNRPPSTTDNGEGADENISDNDIEDGDDQEDKAPVATSDADQIRNTPNSDGAGTTGPPTSHGKRSDPRSAAAAGASATYDEDSDDSSIDQYDEAAEAAATIPIGDVPDHFVRPMKPGQDQTEVLASAQAEHYRSENTRLWEAQFSLLQKYKKEFGSCWVKPGERGEYKGLRSWVARQREQKKMYEMGYVWNMAKLGLGITFEKSARLDALGFTWEANSMPSPTSKPKQKVAILLKSVRTLHAQLADKVFPRSKDAREFLNVTKAIFKEAKQAGKVVNGWVICDGLPLTIASKVGQGSGGGRGGAGVGDHAAKKRKTGPLAVTSDESGSTAASPLPSAGETAIKCVHDFEGTNDAQLTIQAGEELIVMTRASDPGPWLRVRNRFGHEGIIPTASTPLVQQAVSPSPSAAELSSDMSGNAQLGSAGNAHGEGENAASAAADDSFAAGTVGCTTAFNMQDWRRVERTETTRGYWWNVHTQETSWTLPTEGVSQQVEQTKDAAFVENSVDDTEQQSIATSGEGRSSKKIKAPAAALGGGPVAKKHKPSASPSDSTGNRCGCGKVYKMKQNHAPDCTERGSHTGSRSVGAVSGSEDAPGTAADAAAVAVADAAAVAVAVDDEPGRRKDGQRTLPRPQRSARTSENAGASAPVKAQGPQSQQRKLPKPTPQSPSQHLARTRKQPSRTLQETVTQSPSSSRPQRHASATPRVQQQKQQVPTKQDAQTNPKEPSKQKQTQKQKQPTPTSHRSANTSGTFSGKHGGFVKPTPTKTESARKHPFRMPFTKENREVAWSEEYVEAIKALMLKKKATNHDIGAPHGYDRSQISHWFCGRSSGRCGKVITQWYLQNGGAMSRVKFVKEKKP
jgi:hypothetical protein